MPTKPRDPASTMTTPIVTEITRALEPVGRDAFIDGPDGPATVAGARSRHTAARLRGAARARSNGEAAGIGRSRQRASVDRRDSRLIARAA